MYLPVLVNGLAQKDIVYMPVRVDRSGVSQHDIVYLPVLQNVSGVVQTGTVFPETTPADAAKDGAQESVVVANALEPTVVAPTAEICENNRPEQPAEPKKKQRRKRQY